MLTSPSRSLQEENYQSADSRWVDESSGAAQKWSTASFHVRLLSVKEDVR
ncbi:MAG: hypothetical protein HC930_15320, partial [Hydrococcus sp. SU_1_0]|nr:hypothetical protein [Hydrococcus sp. SU_1_0]